MRSEEGQRTSMDGRAGGGSGFASGMRRARMKAKAAAAPRLPLSQEERGRFWDAANGARDASTRARHEAWRVASGSYDATVRVWDGAAGGAALLTLEGHKNVVYAIAFNNP